MKETTNIHGTDEGNLTHVLPSQRMRREAKALEIIKAMRPKGHPEHPETIALRARPLSHTELPSIDPNAPGVVYFLYCGGRLKIGYTTDIKQRLLDFSTHCPFPVTLLLTIKGHLEDEKDLHEEFCEDRMRGEWFNLSLDLREFLSQRFECGSQELMDNAEDEMRELYEGTQQFWKQLQIEFQEEIFQ